MDSIRNSCDVYIHNTYNKAKSGSEEMLHSILFSFYKYNNEQVVIPTATGKKAKSGLPKLLKRDAQWSLWSQQGHLSVLSVSGFFPLRPIGILIPQGWPVEAHRAVVHPLSAWGSVQQRWRSGSQLNSSRPDRPFHQTADLFPNTPSLQIPMCSLKGSSPHWHLALWPCQCWTVKRVDWRPLEHEWWRAQNFRY